MPEQHLAQHDSVVVQRVARRIDERDGASAGEVSKVREEIRMGMDFLRVTAAKLVPSIRVMAEPLTKVRAGRELLEPFVDVRLDFRDSARPEAIDKNPAAVLPLRRLIGTLEAQMGGRDRQLLISRQGR